MLLLGLIIDIGKGLALRHTVVHTLQLASFTILGRIVVLGNGGQCVGVFLGSSLLLLIQTSMPQLLSRVIHGLGKSVCEIKQILGHSDGAEQLSIRPYLLAIEAILKQLLTHPNHSWHLENLLACGSELGLHLDQLLGHLCQFGGKVIGDLRVDTLQNLFIQACHVVCPERRLKRDGFVQDAA